MKYKLINISTGQETLCDKVSIDEFDYYVCDNEIQEENPFIDLRNSELDTEDIYWAGLGGTAEFANTIGKLIIATTNPNIDLPKLVTDIEFLAEEATIKYLNGRDDNAIEFGEWIGERTNKDSWFKYDAGIKKWFWHTKGHLTTEELFEVWKEQKPKTFYYE